MVTHELKSWPESFGPVWSGKKKAEIRIDDRHYQEGDRLMLGEYLPREYRFTGREIEVVVTHVLRGPMFGVPERYVMMSFDVVARRGGVSNLLSER